MPFPSTRPGQFVQLGCRSPQTAIDMTALLGQLLDWDPAEGATPTQPELCAPLALVRRPFSLAGRGENLGGDGGTWIDVIYRVVGVGTQWLVDLQLGDAVDLIGPLGNSFELPTGKGIGLLVGGGVGLPPMFYLAESLHRAGWYAVAFVGALTRDLLAITFDADAAPSVDGQPVSCVKEFYKYGYPTVVTTDDGSYGLRGQITAGLDRFLESQSPLEAAKTVIYTCGPDRMMHAVATLAQKHHLAAQACLEQSMACGMGTCQSCVVRIEDAERPQARTTSGRSWRYNLACTDGPVFATELVVW